MAKKEKSLNEQLDFKNKQLKTYEAELNRYKDLYTKDPSLTCRGYIIATEAKIIKCKSDILLIEAQIFESMQNQP